MTGGIRTLWQVEGINKVMTNVTSPLYILLKRLLLHDQISKSSKILNNQETIHLK